MASVGRMESADRYQCRRCGEETTLPADVARQHCAFCGVSAVELEHVDRVPASTRARFVDSHTRLPLA